ncbi:hypothetical protein MYXO_00020 [Myxococcaceae bacterium]|nr:hypothetical protein MYXO_00020 [Myxococcaceae bacterium]
MRPTNDPEERSPARDEAFVRRVAQAYLPPLRSEVKQRAFAAKVDAALRANPRIPSSSWPWLAAATAMAMAAFVLFGRASVESPEVASTEPRIVRTEPRTRAEAVSADAWFSEFEVRSDPNEALPEDYAAISGVLLGS